MCLQPFSCLLNTYMNKGWYIYVALILHEDGTADGGRQTRVDKPPVYFLFLRQHRYFSFSFRSTLVGAFIMNLSSSSYGLSPRKVEKLPKRDSDQVELRVIWHRPLIYYYTGFVERRGVKQGREISRWHRGCTSTNFRDKSRRFTAL